MQQSRSSGSGGWGEAAWSSGWQEGRQDRTGTWIWNSGWDEAAWSSNGWQEGWQDDGAEEDSPTKDSRQPHDPDAPQREPWENCADGQDANSDGADDQLLVPAEDSATEPTNGGLAAEPAKNNEKDVVRSLHEKALWCFHRDVPEPGSDDDEVPAGAQKTQMLVDHEIEVPAGIAEFHPATGGVTCKLCNNMALNSKSQWADHQKGKKHFKKLSAEERKKRAKDVRKLDRTNVPAASFQ